jgi:hypothetical protein
VNRSFDVVVNDLDVHSVVAATFDALSRYAMWAGVVMDVVDELTPLLNSAAFPTDQALVICVDPTRRNEWGRFVVEARWEVA